ncbi:hypothetical protein FWC31_02585 [Candidatus Saccharibacteria bacterium]|nr:hypothetical protein [Candidatus Saccharibacteria bacterium]
MEGDLYFGRAENCTQYSAPKAVPEENILVGDKIVTADYHGYERYVDDVTRGMYERARTEIGCGSCRIVCDNAIEKNVGVHKGRDRGGTVLWSFVNTTGFSRDCGRGRTFEIPENVETVEIPETNPGL